VVVRRVAASLFPDWRTVASKTDIREKESTRPEDNNYDGRNYITE